MEALLQDLRHAARALVKTPGFTIVAVVTLALGIGANTAIFSVVNGVLLAPLPYREPERLVTVNHYYPSLNNLRAPVSVPGFRDYSARTDIFASAAVENGAAMNMTGGAEPERINVEKVSGQYFPLLGTAAAVGRKVTLDNQDYQIVGVLPASFRDFFSRRTDLFMPIVFSADQFADSRRTNEFLPFIGRLAPGVTLERAQSELHTPAVQLPTTHTQNYAPHWGLTATARPATE